MLHNEKPYNEKSSHNTVTTVISSILKCAEVAVQIAVT
jgi:hypothetical protein